jgi:hypothetical protein
MARTRYTARKSTGRLPVGQLAPRNVPQPQESQPDVQQEASPEEEPFEIELVVPESPMAPVLTGRPRALLEHLGITAAPWYRIKEVPRSGWVEFKAIIEIFFGSRVLCQHKGPAFRTSHRDVVADNAWQAITSWVRSNKGRLHNSIHYLLPYSKKGQFKAYGVKRDIPRMEMVHH